jgi:hypothetical protein
VADRYFSPGEVESLIPALTEIMARVMKAHAEAAGVKERLTTEQHHIALAGGALIDAEAWRAARAELENLTARVRAGLDEIVELGGVPKDVGAGLVDFRHLRDGRDVNLCWKYGERDIRWWHGLDEGYAGRKPL